MQLLTDKVALVTGGARGQGRTEAKLFAEHGATVVITDILDEQGRETATSLRNDGHDVVYQSLDVSNESQWKDTIDLMEVEFGELDVLVNNAGVINGETIVEETVEGWDRVIDVNLKGVWLGMKHAIPLMCETGGGRGVNTSSIYGIAGGMGDCASYHAAKGGVTVLTKNAAVGYADDGIRANSIHPGVVTEPMGDTEGTDESSGPDELLEMTPQRRGATLDEFANAALFLASDMSSFVNGVDLHVDGGFLAR
jgi:NAD(P)-dependent dehydrogenase (short-subunit alcohol dehydrogenase family)